MNHFDDLRDSEKRKIRTFVRKGFGRMFVQSPDQIDQVKDLLKKFDRFEFDYLPDGFIAPATEFPTLIFSQKFDGLDIDAFTNFCMNEGVTVLCVVGENPGQN